MEFVLPLHRRLTAGLMCAACVLAALPAAAGSLAPGLARQLADRQPDDVIRVLVVLRDQVAVAALDARLSTEKAGRGRRHELIVAELQQQAAVAQHDLLQALGADKAAGAVRGYTPHWLVNAVVVTGTVAAVRKLAARDDVRRVEADLVPELIAPVSSWLPPTKQAAGIGITPGVVAIGARRVWQELGFDGSGTLVGIIDTGVDVNHPALSARWRGNFADPATAWLDAAEVGQPVLPADGQGHGTHVMGTLTGLADGDTIGVAPGAQWIATNAISAPVVTFDNAIIASLEFMTDPDGDPATSDDVPDVVQNSWGVSEAFAGYIDCDSSWWDLIDNCEAAGVVLVWAAGNEGGGGNAGTVRSPADRATNPYNCFSVGSTSNHAPFLISDFSSRGPSGCGGPYAIKPELTAPGDTIYSALPGGGYIYRNGTSMAGPHVAGVVALMRQANPDVDVVTIKDILLRSALDQGLVGEDNDYGHGLVDAYAAVRAVLSGIGTIGGTVTDAATGLPLAGARLQLDGGFNQAVSDDQGQYSLTMTAGGVSFTVSAFGYDDGQITAAIPDGGQVTGDVALVPRLVVALTGTVRGPDLLPVAGATVTVEDTPLPVAVTDTAGFYRVDLPVDAAQPYSVRVVADGLGYQEQQILVTGAVSLDFDLPDLTWEDFESGDFASFPWRFSGSAPWGLDTATVYEGQYAAVSTVIGDAQTAELHLDYYVAGDGDLRFRYKVSSEFSFDFLYFLIDGVEAGAWSGEVDWSLFSRTIPTGNHTFSWIYAKDEVIGEGADRAWLDFVEFPVTGIEPLPQLAFSPVSVVVTLAPGGNAVRTVTLENAGTADLAYSLSATPLTKAVPGEAVPARRPAPRSHLAKGEKDNAPTVAIRPTGGGGPDAFGYTWQDSDDLDGPVYGWEDIGAVGTVAGTGDDLSLGAFDLGFAMTFYGEVFTTVRISTNGFLSFSGTSSPYLNQALPDGVAPQNVVAPFWDDLDATAGGRILYWADPDADRFIVQFEDVPRYDSPATETFQVILRGSGSLTFQYRNVSETEFCTVGIEDGAGADGLTVLYNAPDYLHDGLAIRFSPAEFLPWVQISPLAGVIPPGQSAAVTLQFDATDLAPGTSVATLNITSNDPETATTLVPLLLTVAAVSEVTTGGPQAMILAGAVPNPFNPRTEIRYTLPGAGPVTLRVHDVRGRLVRELVAGSQAAGPHLVLWDGRDSGGRAVASGTYYARLVFAGRSRVTAMTLVR